MLPMDSGGRYVTYGWWRTICYLWIVEDGTLPITYSWWRTVSYLWLAENGILPMPNLFLTSNTLSLTSTSPVALHVTVQSLTIWSNHLNPEEVIFTGQQPFHFKPGVIGILTHHLNRLVKLI